MALQLQELDEERDWPELARCMLESYEEPKQSLYDLFFPILGSGPGARGEALTEHAERLRDWHADPDSYWHKVVDSSTGEMAAAALWKIHRENPFAQHEDHTAYWYPKHDSRQEYVTKAIEIFDEPRSRAAQRPHLYLNIIFTHPRHRNRGAADLIMKWGLDKAKELDYEIFLDCFPPARDFYPKYGFGLIQQNDIRPQRAEPDADWQQIDAQLQPLTTWLMWRPRDGPYVEGKSVRPWESS